MDIQLAPQALTETFPFTVPGIEVVPVVKLLNLRSAGAITFPIMVVFGNVFSVIWSTFLQM